MKLLCSLLLLCSFSAAQPGLARADDPTEGERLLTPNQLKRIEQANQDLPAYLRDQAGDSSAVTELRQQLRQAYSGYRQAVKQHGSKTPETRQAAHQVLEVYTALRKQFIREEAIPALTQLPR